MEEKMDLRVRKTHRALMQALRELMGEKRFEEISVTELCERAQTRRATFYKHFRDKNDLLARMIQQLQQAHAARDEDRFDVRNLGGYLTRIFRYLLDFLDENRDMARTIASSQAQSVVLDILGQQLENDLKARLAASAGEVAEDPLAAEMLAVLCSGAVANCARWWIPRSDGLPKERAVELFRLFMDRSQEG